MKDELWMRTWDEGHPRFSDDLHRGLMWLLASYGASVAGSRDLLPLRKRRLCR